MKLRIIDILVSEYNFTGEYNSHNLLTFIKENLSNKQVFGLVKKAYNNHELILNKSGIFDLSRIWTRDELLTKLEYLFNSELYRGYFDSQNKKQLVNN